MVLVDCRSTVIVVAVVVCLLMYVCVHVTRRQTSELDIGVTNVRTGVFRYMSFSRQLTDKELYYQIVVYDRYFDPREHGVVTRHSPQKHLLRCQKVGCYGGVDALRRVARAPIKVVQRRLSEQDAYILHKPVRTRFKRRCVVVGDRNQQWQADLVDLSKLKRDNDGITFLLTVIDVFSKQAWCVPLKNKSAASLVAALESLFADHRPTTLQTDKGLEFLNRSVQSLLRKQGIHHFSTHNEETKASIVERFNRTLKTRKWRYMTKRQATRYVDALQDFVRSYNDTHHRSIGMAPSQVNAVSQE